MNREEIKEQELKFLSEEFNKNPDLFKGETHIDDSQFLEKIGIFLSEEIQKNIFPGYLRLWPQDFIVEEILKNGDVQTIDIKDFLNNKIETGTTIYATLVKCGLSTIEAVEEIASLLKIDRKKIQFAGIKDKVAITAQRISFRDANLDVVKNIASPYFFLKNIQYEKGVVEIGGLKGNTFTILVRTDESFQKEKFLKSVEKINSDGFFNFFYSQRFGSPRFINWFWGSLILKGEYKKAVLSFLCSEGQREIEYFKKIRSEIKNQFGNWQSIEHILKPFPLVLHHETKIVRYLKNNPADFIGALNQISEQIQLWVFAYASLLFNRKISEYIKNNAPLPEKLPLIVSNDKNDWKEYYGFLKEDEINQFPISHLKPFPFIQWKKRRISTKEKAQIHKIKIIPEGVVISFTLPKASYATTFLSHLFQLTSGFPPQQFSDKAIDIKEALEKKNIQGVLEKFQKVIYPKTQDAFEKFSI